MPECGKWNFHFWSRDGRPESPCDMFSPPLSKKARGRLSLSLDHLAQQPKDEWSRPHASPLGDHKYVIRFKDETGGQKRLFGHFYDAHSAFVITLSGYEKDGQYHPSDYGPRCANCKLECDADFTGHTKPVESRCDICGNKRDIRKVPGSSLKLR